MESDRDNSSLRMQLMDSLPKSTRDLITKAETFTTPYSDTSVVNNEIVFAQLKDGVKVVKEGSAHQLVNYLVDPNVFDLNFMQTFLFTYQMFMKPHDLLDILLDKLNHSFMRGKAEAGPEALRIINTLKYWIENYFTDFEQDRLVLERLNSFLEDYTKDKSWESLVNILTGLVQRKLLNAKTPIETSTQISIPKPIKNNINIQSIIDIDPKELARQLTLLEFSLFSSIQSREFLDLGWMKDDKESRSPNIVKFTNWSNHVVGWLMTEILRHPDNIKRRVKSMESIIQLGHYLDKLNNFNGMKEVLSALQSSAVFRLKKTKDMVSQKSEKALDQLKSLLSTELNHKNVRHRIHSAQPPILPFPGIYQGDLVFLDTVGKNQSDGIVNFQKFQKFASYVFELQVCHCHSRI